MANYVDGGSQEVVVVKYGAIAATGDIAAATYSPGYQPVVIRAVSLTIVDTIACAGAVVLDKRPTAGSDTSRGDADITTINIPNATAVGTVIYKDGLNVTLSPGEEAVAEVSNACGGSGKATITLFVDPDPELPANLDMTETS